MPTPASASPRSRRPAPDGCLLVLERGFTAGVGNTVRLCLADPRRATDTGGIARLTGQDGVRLVRRTLLADLVTCPSLGATAKQPQPNPLLDNVEGTAVTGRGRGGLEVLPVSDDNRNAARTTRFSFLRIRVRAPRIRARPFTDCCGGMKSASVRVGAFR